MIDRGPSALSMFLGVWGCGSEQEGTIKTWMVITVVHHVNGINAIELYS